MHYLLLRAAFVVFLATASWLLLALINQLILILGGQRITKCINLVIPSIVYFVKVTSLLKQSYYKKCMF